MTEKNNLLEKEWERYRRMTIPPDAGPGQLSDLKKAFFGGAMSLHTIVVTKMNGDDGEEDAKIMEGLDNEMIEFALDVIGATRGSATRQ
jgi:hypothetical protein